MRVNCLHVAIALIALLVRRSVGFSSTTGGDTFRSSYIEISATAANDDRASYIDNDATISEDNPLRVIIAGGGIGSLVVANSLCINPKMSIQVLEKTDQSKRLAGPIQLGSNALAVIQEMDSSIFKNITSSITSIGDKVNGIKSGITDDWYSQFDLASPCGDIPYSGVMERQTLQQIYFDALPRGVVEYGDAVVSYEINSDGYGVRAITESGRIVHGDCLIGADGIWSSIRSTMRDEPVRGEGSGCTYSGYTVFDGELAYDSIDNGEVGYKVYIGPKQYFVACDIGNGKYHWYAFMAKPEGSSIEEDKPNGTSVYLQNIFEGWAHDIKDIIQSTVEKDIGQRDLYDQAPSKKWTDGNVALLGDSVHTMMPSLCQGGCQAIEDAYVLVEELNSVSSRDEIEIKLRTYARRRVVRSAVVQGLSRFASDIIIRGFDTPAKIRKIEDGTIKFENCNYAGVVTKLLQPILPLFFGIQFTFLFSGWRNNSALDLNSALRLLLVGGAILLICSGIVEESALFAGLGFEGLLGLDLDINIGSVFKTSNDVFDISDIVDAFVHKLVPNES
mmetsp:Transcript_25518/g.51180  ORF Transcript_25518/g.51180 Transcript_25518/m.51180 type:complete len:561 (+) Transcript_25518:298-1980(+)